LAKLPAAFTKQVQQINPFYEHAINLIAANKKEREAEEKSQQQQNPVSSSETTTDNRNQNLSGLNNTGNKTELNEIQKTNTDMKPIKNLETDKIFSMKKIAGLKHQLLSFNGKWFDFFGLPQTNFFCVVHGMSGEGKSHFAMQLGKYLAERFGNVLYISGEEGFASTFQQKIEALGASIERYYATEIKTGEEVLKDVPNQYHFIIIDSLNNMGIDTELMRAIRAKFKQSGIIAICQSTKDGKIRGSYEIVHDSDMAVKVVNGIATTTKNRFKEKHQDFDVFAVYNKKKDQVPKKKNEGNSSLDEDFDNTIR
jgi:predicted ATP-dependent serine protease